MSASSHRRSPCPLARLSEGDKVELRMHYLSREVSEACDEWLEAHGIESRPFGLNAAQANLERTAGTRADRPDPAPTGGLTKV